MLDFVRGGKGLVVTHSGVDAFYGSKGYREMIGGGLFKAHPWTQLVRVKVEDPVERGGLAPRRGLRPARRDLRHRHEPALEQPRPALARHAERRRRPGSSGRHVGRLSRLLDPQLRAGPRLRHRARPLRRRVAQPGVSAARAAGHAHRRRPRPRRLHRSSHEGDDRRQRLARRHRDRRLQRRLDRRADGQDPSLRSRDEADRPSPRSSSRRIRRTSSTA